MNFNLLIGLGTLATSDTLHAGAKFEGIACTFPHTHSLSSDSNSGNSREALLGAVNTRIAWDEELTVTEAAVGTHPSPATAKILNEARARRLQAGFQVETCLRKRAIETANSFK
jgi:hypothetical protein